MALKAIVDTLDAVPEAVRGEYEQRDGKFVLKVEGAEDAYAGGIKRNRDEALSEKKKLQDRLQAFGDLTPEEAQRLRDLEKGLKEKKAKDEGDFASLKEQLVAEHKKEIEKRDAHATKLEKALDRVAIDDAATTAIAKLEGRPTLLLPHVRRYLKRVEEGDDFKVIVVDDKGNPRVSGTNGDLMTVDQLVAEMKTKDEYAGGFKGSGASGSGAGGSGPVATGDKILITRADGRDPAKYRAAKARAEKEGKTLDWAD